MDLLPKDILEKLTAADSTRGDGRGERALLKLFDPSGRYTFYVFEAEEYEEDVLLYGFCVSPLGADCDEWGPASLSEIKAVRGRFGLGIERDIWFDGVTRDELAAGARP